MFRDWKIGTFNGVFVASYFIPAWAVPALDIVKFPVRGLYDRANISPAIFVSDYLQFDQLAMVRFAWMLALAKLTVVAFFAVFLLLTLWKPTRDRAAGEEALSFALILGGFVSMASMLFAAKVGELQALQLHATESLLIMSIGIVMLIEGVSERDAKALAASRNASTGSASAGAMISNTMSSGVISAAVLAQPVTVQSVMTRDAYPLSNPNS
jgi:hypothetical protein